MRALILIGGRGTRLRPFTLSTPKPLLPIANQCLLEYQFQILRKHGVRDVILCTHYQPSAFRKALGDGRRFGLRLHYVHEKTALGTGGAVRNAEEHVQGRVLVLNGDLLNALDIGRFLQSHRRSRADVSISLTKVKDPSQYGLVKTDARGKILSFLEKPSPDEVSTTNTVNAGAYLFEPAVVRQIPPNTPYSLERELFPSLLKGGFHLNGFVSSEYWIDIGTVDTYLRAHLDILGNNNPFQPRGLAKKGTFLLDRGVRLDPSVEHDRQGNVAVGRGSRVEKSVRFFGPVSIGPRCVISKGAVLDRCVVLEGTRIGESARLENCIVGRRCRIGANAVIDDDALGDGSVIGKFSQLGR